jgi:hypothetical protein
MDNEMGEASKMLVGETQRKRLVGLPRRRIREIAVSLDMTFNFAHTAAASDLRAQRILNFCAHKIMCFLIAIHL